jgi:hypothetical protein
VTATDSRRLWRDSSARCSGIRPEEQMKDRLWQAVYDALRPLLNKTDVVLVPKGDWPEFHCTAAFYEDLIDVANCSVLVLHKGQFTSLPKPELQRIADQWQWIFANEVFVVFSSIPKIAKDARHTGDHRHCRPLLRFLRSASLRQRGSKIVYVHVPKTGGTSMWASLTRAFPSHVYYSSQRAYLCNPPAPGDYDLIGVHFSPAVLLHSLTEEDWLIGMVREPTQRFLSGVAHSRRATEDPHTFSASARAMREMRLADYLATEFGRVEARLQLITFGADPRQPQAMSSDEVLLSSALSLARRKNVVLAPSEHSRAFRDDLARRLSFRPGALARLNANTPAAIKANLDASITLLNAINRREREFYDFICSSFAERKSAGTKRYVGAASRSLSRLGASVTMRAALG